MVLDQLRKWMLENGFRGALSVLNVLQGNLEIAEKLLKNEVNILLDYQIKSKDDSPATLMIRCDLNAAHALVMLERGNTTDSLSELQNVLDQRKYHLGKDDPKTLSTYLDIAKVYMHPKSAKSYEKYRDAPQMLNYCYEKYKDSLGNEHPNTIEAHYNLAYLDYMRSEDQNAIDKFMTVRDIQEKVYGINHIKTMETRGRIMEVFQRRKFYNRAVVINDGGEVLFQKYMVKVGDTHPDTIRVAHFYALSCFGFAHKKDNEKTNLTPEEEIHWFKRGDNAMFKCITGSIKLFGADHKDVLERIKILNKERKVIATLKKRYNL